MKFPFRLCALLLLWAGVSGKAQDLPVKSGASDLQREAGQLIDGLPNLNQDSPVPEMTEQAPLSVEAEKARLAAAQKKQQRWEKLQRQGVLSQAEAEQCQIEVAVALSRYEHACVAQAQSQCDAAQHVQPVNTALQQAAAAALESSKALSADADLQLGHTRLRLAEVHLERMRRLYSEKLTTRNEVERAQNLVAKLQGQNNQAVPSSPTAAP